MAVFIVLWPYSFTTKLSCLQKNNFGHTNPGMGAGLYKSVHLPTYGAIIDLNDLRCKV